MKLADLEPEPPADRPRRPGVGHAAGRGGPPDRVEHRGRLSRHGQGARRLDLAGQRRLPPRAAPARATSGPRTSTALTPTKNGDQILLRRFDGKAWQPAIAVTDGAAGRLAADRGRRRQGRRLGRLGQQVDGDWEIFRRTYTPAHAGDGEGTWSDIVRVTRTPGSDFHVVAATDAAGTVWLAWQGWREDNYEILVAALKDGHARASPGSISHEPGQRLEPGDRRRRQGERLRRLGHLRQGQLRRPAPRRRRATTASWAVADSPRFEGRPAPGLRQGRPGLDRLRGRGRAVGQGLRPRRRRDATSAWRRTPASPSTSTGPSG